MSAMRYQFRNCSGQVVGGNLCAQCQSCARAAAAGVAPPADCAICNSRTRRGRSESTRAEVFLCSSYRDHLRSVRVFKSCLAAYLAAAEDLAAQWAILTSGSHGPVAEVKRLVHNITSINGHSVQDTFNFISQAALVQNYRGQLETVEREVRARPRDAAAMFLRILKGNLRMKVEFVVFQYLGGSPVPRPELKTHVLKPVVLNVFHVFFPDFTEKGVRVEVDDSSVSVRIDYETFSAAFYDFCDNAVKYVMPGSRVHVRISEECDRVWLVLQMHSYPIGEDEVDRIWEEGFSGAYPKKMSVAGTGIGMFRARRLLEFNEAEVKVAAKYDGKKSLTRTGFEFRANQFWIGLRKAT